MAEPKQDHAFEKEKVILAEKYIRVVDKFTPRYGGTLLTEKFYARHDALSEEAAKKPNVYKYMKEVAHRQISNPRDNHPAPVIESHKYGWLYDKAIVYEGEDDIELHVHRKKVDLIMKIQMDVNLGMKRDRMYHMLR